MHMFVFLGFHYRNTHNTKENIRFTETHGHLQKDMSSPRAPLNVAPNLLDRAQAAKCWRACHKLPPKPPEGGRFNQSC
eukprot:5108163-Lingulodinium_polyedra.AAC.1